MLLIRKYDHKNNLKVHYEGRLVSRSEHSVTANAEWTSPAVNLGYVKLDAGDIFVETFYDNRWFNIFKITSHTTGEVKGWYANITRPSRISKNAIEWDDLALDVWMWTNGHMQVMDEHEFAEIKPELQPLEQQQAMIALDEVQAALHTEWRTYANDQIADLLGKRKWTLGTAESCTGGLIGDTLTNRAGSSSYFWGGVVSYANEIKHNVLGVRTETLARMGAVSEEVALQMARGVRTALKVDVGISATGVAGPGGGSAEKPVGLAYLGFSGPNGEKAQRFVWPFDRVGNKQASADAALKLLLEMLRQ
jgi:PncC family amidohydrolase